MSHDGVDAWPQRGAPLLEAVPDPLELASNDRVTGVGGMDLEIEPAHESVSLLDQQQSASAFHGRKGIDKPDACRLARRLTWVGTR